VLCHWCSAFAGSPDPSRVDARGARKCRRCNMPGNLNDPAFEQEKTTFPPPSSLLTSSCSAPSDHEKVLCRRRGGKDLHKRSTGGGLAPGGRARPLLENSSWSRSPRHKKSCFWNSAPYRRAIWIASGLSPHLRATRGANFLPGGVAKASRGLWEKRGARREHLLLQRDTESSSGLLH
jgi:hypothetical protein